MGKYGRGLHPVTYRWIYQGAGIYLVRSTAKRKMDVGIVACQGQSKRGDDFRKWSLKYIVAARGKYIRLQTPKLC